MVTEETLRDAQRNILIGWGRLSLGDVSTIQASIQTGQTIMTVQTCPLGNFWKQVVRLEWAIEQEIPSQLLNNAPDLACFQLTKGGCQKLERFIDYRKLFDLSAWNHAPAERKPPIIFVGRDYVFALPDPEKYPVNFITIPNLPNLDQTALVMAKQGQTIYRFDPEGVQHGGHAPDRNNP